ncbi:hypothetical protein [Mycolicibacterium fortuitum]|uniref:Uncharacterized protein n=1 Tax=Mycolicibacterium fortuitum TaxID=1766 RepID=A0AAE4V802_MYCFO|nr:hypothetical protein [Mycolicibacterium fortuitum]MDV7194623.1 hypothetical protein [Mycolicibacterium fortuitum]MDV7208623.1 hypothetical protein [Mycolicibacterium fortuitum]MDV7230520.1 hypothetical protein [Mycolicibacterium fortuitum]MDV7261873.1 hypothetical protein [Mycolicibacterium fortuitum]MDV7287018.1 hypothetical protein [Mycolicibacterium fortuitum]
MATALEWVIATLLIAGFSAALVFIDPLTLIADWWTDRRYDKDHR